MEEQQIETVEQVKSVSVYETADYSIELVHQVTLGDFLTSTMLGVLIIVVLLSRLIGGR